MPTPTLYDNFSRVKEWSIDKFADKESLSYYVTDSELNACGYLTSIPSEYITESELSGCSYITSDVKELTGPLYITYQETNNTLYGLKSYSHIVAGDENKTTPAFLASKRYCANGVGSYVNMASFFVNSDGRSKFAHKASSGGGNDDSFMCFNAYGFKVAYSGAAGTAATTEYEILHEGNIGNLGYVTSSDLPVINESIIPKENNTYTLGDADHRYNITYSTNIRTENVSYTSGKSSIKMNDRNVDIWANNKKMVNVSDYDGVIPTQTNVNLGGSSKKWAATYTADLYADNIHNFIWTGTSVEYASLPDYTTYQIYMIQEA